MAESPSPSYVPALGLRSLTPIYDSVVAWTTRETYFKGLLLQQAGVSQGDGGSTKALEKMREAPRPESELRGATLLGTLSLYQARAP